MVLFGGGVLFLVGGTVRSWVYNITHCYLFVVGFTCCGVFVGCWFIVGGGVIVVGCTSLAILVLIVCGWFP